jgi:hypothetical protein
MQSLKPIVAELYKSFRIDEGNLAAIPMKLSYIFT